jgi:cellulose synthase/poly-beta-1,6-N-acetylglucosamine synthase-like glycosyltransferase
MHAGYMFLQSDTNMSTAPLVSILLPTKNGADYLSRAVQGVQLQSYRYWELIIIDDGSTDATPKLLQQLAKDEPRVKTLRVEHPTVCLVRFLLVCALHGVNLWPGLMMTTSWRM